MDDEPTTIPCPKCSAAMDLRASWCPLCRQPRSEVEIAEGVRKAEAPKKRLKGALATVLALILGAGAYHLTNKVRAGMRAEEESRKAAEPAAPPSKAPPAKARSAALWTVEGRVYDLLSLRPIPGARLVFKDRLTGRRFTASTDAKGNYTLSLPPVQEGGYQPSIEHKLYGDRFLEDMSPAFSGQTREAREEALNLLESNILHVPILLTRKETSLRYDAVMRLPERTEE